MRNTLNPFVLLVEDDDSIRKTTRAILEHAGFHVVEAANAHDALEILPVQSFDALVTDLHMPKDGDGLTVVSAMRHFNPDAVTLILSGFPEMNKAAAAILAQADGILVKPCGPLNLIDSLWDHLKKVRVVSPARATVATILDEGTESTIADWLVRVDGNPDIFKVKMKDKDRASHLPQLFKDLVVRLRSPLQLDSPECSSPAAVAHGLLRREQGYTAAMVVEESRMLQVSIFQTLQNNLFRVNFSKVLESVMVIADEVDAQLAQAMKSYVSEPKADAQPAETSPRPFRPFRFGVSDR
jgi:CheY-like chemotaxis protein